MRLAHTPRSYQNWRRTALVAMVNASDEREIPSRLVLVDVRIKNRARL
jgi:hypothetical protein